MKRFLMIVMVTAGVAVATNAAGVRQREVNQQGRIVQGVRSGSLTRGETRRLERQEGALHREIVRDRISGGHLGPMERAHIKRQKCRRAILRPGAKGRLSTERRSCRQRSDSTAPADATREAADAGRGRYR